VGKKKEKNRGGVDSGEKHRGMVRALLIASTGRELKEEKYL